MPDDFIGVIIEESLHDKGILKKVKILKTKIEKVTERHKTPYLKTWTLHTIEVKEEDAAKIAEEISVSFDRIHTDWYADYKNKKLHYIIFPNKVFIVKSGEGYGEAARHGIALGIPDYQLDFH